ncbi:MAG: heparan-alpha-glucosaminide N-acetyltransferase domain-containing protein [candidate division WOR-3 bacterium]
MDIAGNRPDAGSAENPSPAQVSHSSESRRIQAVDVFRGMAVAVMVVANYLEPLTVTPGWLQHAQPLSGLNFLDIGFPFFVFISGMLLPGSLARRLALGGWRKTLFHFLKRNLLLIAFGIAGTLLLRGHPLRDWGVLQAFGLAGLVALPFARLRPGARFAAGLVLITAYQVMLSLGYAEWLLGHEHGDLGGIAGCIAWAGVMLIGSFLSRHLSDLRQSLVWSASLALALGIAGFALHYVVPVTKPLVTASYALVCCGLAAAGFALVLGLDIAGIRLAHFALFGANPLVCYMLSGVLAEGLRSLVPEPTLLPALALASLIYLVCFLCALFLRRRGIFVKL